MPRHTVTAVLDADVLVPLLTCDLLLTAFELELYLPVVTTKILAEVERSLIVDFPRIDSSVLLHRARLMAAALEFNTYPDVEDHRDRVATVNAKDRHVASAAARLKATVVVTNDRRLREEINAPDRPFRGVTGDTFLASLADEDPARFGAVIDALVAKRTRPAIDRARLLVALEPMFPILVGRVRAPK